jgi:hypothetical protein
MGKLVFQVVGVCASLKAIVLQMGQARAGQLEPGDQQREPHQANHVLHDRGYQRIHG